MGHIIVNADDCGLNREVNLAIAHFAEQGYLSSTSLLANGAELAGALELFHRFNHISFGAHLNLTEGRPLTQSQQLLDIGLYKEEGGVLLFNGKVFSREWLTSEARGEIMKELVAQVEALRDFGFELSHLDSHHHIHTAYFCYLILPELCDKVGIHRVRNIRNCYGKYSLTQMVRQLWRKGLSLRNGVLRFPDIFCDLTTYAQIMAQDANRFASYDVVELACHPGHVKYGLQEELLCQKMSDEAWYGRRLVSYRDL